MWLQQNQRTRTWDSFQLLSCLHISLFSNFFFFFIITVDLFWSSSNLTSMLEDVLFIKPQQIAFVGKEKPTQDILSKSESRLQACTTLLNTSKIGTVLIWLLQYIRCLLLISMSWQKKSVLHYGRGKGYSLIAFKNVACRSPSKILLIDRVSIMSSGRHTI